MMKGTDEEEKLERAWRIYSRRRLEELGFGDQWKRAYLELDEFDLFMGSYYPPGAPAWLYGTASGVFLRLDERGPRIKTSKTD